MIEGPFLDDDPIMTLEVLPLSAGRKSWPRALARATTTWEVNINLRQHGKTSTGSAPAPGGICITDYDLNFTQDLGIEAYHVYQSVYLPTYTFKLPSYQVNGISQADSWICAS